MKASLASMVVAAEDLVENDEIGFGRISFLITSDEEGPAVHGTKFAIEQLSKEVFVPIFVLLESPVQQKNSGYNKMREAWLDKCAFANQGHSGSRRLSG